MQIDDTPQIQIEDREESPPKAASLWRWQIVLCFGLFALVGLNNGAVGVQLPDLRSFYRLDNSAVGLFYLGETLGYAIAAFYIGSLVERLGLRRYALLGLAIFALGALILGLAPPLIMALLIRPAMGFGSAMMEGSANLFVARLPRPTTFLNYLHALFGAGSLVGPLAATFILTAGWGWNGIYLVWLLLSLPLLLGSRLFFPAKVVKAESKAASGDKTEQQSGNLMRSTLALPVVWLGSIFLVVYVGVELGVGAWAYSFLTEARLYDSVFSGWVVSGYWLGLTLGRLTMARLMEHLQVGNRGLIQLGLGLAGIGIVVVWWGSGEVVSAVGLGLLGLGLGPVFPTTLSILARLVPPRLLSSTVGFACSLSILGATIFPALAGLIADAFGLGLFMPYILVLWFLTWGVWLVFLRKAGRSLVG